VPEQEGPSGPEQGGPWDPVQGFQGSLAAMRNLIARSSLPAKHLDATLRDVRARREQVRALAQQLATFDEQLAALEQTLQPLVEWSGTWARMEQTFLDAFPPRGSADDAPGTT
jgi:hypothetical protein